MTLTPSRVRELVCDVISAGHLAGSGIDGCRAELAVLADDAVDWTDPKGPTVHGRCVGRLGDDSIWERISTAQPEWMNLAALRLDDGAPVLVVSWSKTSPPYYTDPAISLSNGPDGVLIHLMEEED